MFHITWAFHTKLFQVSKAGNDRLMLPKCFYKIEKKINETQIKQFRDFAEFKSFGCVFIGLLSCWNPWVPYCDFCLLPWSGSVLSIQFICSWWTLKLQNFVTIVVLRQMIISLFLRDLEVINFWANSQESENREEPLHLQKYVWFSSMLPSASLLFFCFLLKLIARKALIVTTHLSSITGFDAQQSRVYVLLLDQCPLWRTFRRSSFAETRTSAVDRFAIPSVVLLQWAMQLSSSSFANKSAKQFISRCKVYCICRLFHETIFCSIQWQRGTVSSRVFHSKLEIWSALYHVHF